MPTYVFSTAVTCRPMKKESNTGISEMNAPQMKAVWTPPLELRFSPDPAASAVAVPVVMRVMNSAVPAAPATCWRVFTIGTVRVQAFR